MLTLHLSLKKRYRSLFQGNYRPVSNLPVISKILEKLLVVTHPNDISHESVSVEVPMWLLKGIQCSALRTVDTKNDFGALPMISQKHSIVCHMTLLLLNSMVMD